MKNRCTALFILAGILSLAMLFSGPSCSKGEPGGNAGNDDDDASAQLPTAQVWVADAPEDNPLARRIQVHTDAPCSLAGYVTTPGEPGYSPSDPVASARGTDHSFWFYGLFEHSSFDYTLHLAGDPGAIVAAGSFNTPVVTGSVPQFAQLVFDQNDGFTDWFAVLHNVRISDNHNIVALYDRQGRRRFYRKRPDSAFHSLAPDGQIVLTTPNELVALDKNGDMRLLFEVQLGLDNVRKTHHQFHLWDGGPAFATVLYNQYGPGLQCDFVTPTDLAVGDGIAEVDENGVVLWSWSVFDHQDAVGPDAVDPELCALASWGPDTVDWTHGNSVSPFLDQSAYLVSLRNVFRVIKINRLTGDVVWQLGPGLDFTWIGDEPEADQWQRSQHDAQWLTPTRMLLYDNGLCRYGGSCLEGPWSRALEIDVDEHARTVRQVWEYRTPFSRLQGDVHRHENGNTLISTGGSLTVIEVPPQAQQGEEIFRITFDDELTRLVRAIYHPPLWQNGDPTKR